MKARRIPSTDSNVLKAQGVEGFSGISLVVGRGDASGSLGWLLFKATQNNSNSEDLSARSIRLDAIDWSVVKRWLNHCDTKHESSCASINSVSLPGFRVIDCDTSGIVIAPRDCWFAGLSYVWGASAAITADGSLHELPIPASLLIEDARVWVEHSLSDNLQASTGRRFERSAIMERMRTYLKRKLSYESDSSNAFLGIVNQFWDSDDPLYHLWGLPFHTRAPKTVCTVGDATFERITVASSS